MNASTPSSAQDLLHIRVPKPLADDIRRLAADTERSVTATARIALREFADRQREAKSE